LYCTVPTFAAWSTHLISFLIRLSPASSYSLSVSFYCSPQCSVLKYLLLIEAWKYVMDNIQFLTQRRYCLPIRNSSWSMPFRIITVICSDNYNETLKILFRQNSIFSIEACSLYTAVTTVLYRSDVCSSLHMRF
jgi:hypothetical protein